MSSKMYKKGKLTNAAQKKFAKRLDKENKKYLNKNKRSKKEAKQNGNEKIAKKEIKSQNTSAMNNNETKEMKNIQSPLKDTQKQKVLSELTMNDICETPKRQNLVKARKEAMDQNNDVNWISLIGYNQIEAENEERLYKKLEIKSNNRFRNDLDNQIKIKQKQQNEQRNAKNKHKNALNEQYKQYKVEDLQKEESKHSKMLALKEIRESQVHELEYRRKYEVLKMRKHELREVSKLKGALAQEAIKNQLKKEENMAKLQQFLLDNEKQKKIKEQSRLNEESEAIRLQKEYAKMLLLQEQKREKQLQATYEKMNKKFNALISATADIREKAEEDAKKAEIELKKRQIIADKKEEAKKEKLRQGMAECKKAIDAQIREKMNRIKNDILENKAYGKKMVELHNGYLKEIEDKKAGKYRKQQEQATYLEQQISLLHKKQREGKTEMSHTEKLLNKQLLDKVRKIKLSPNKKEIMMKKKESSIKIDQRAPFQWRYAYRKAPF